MTRAALKTQALRCLLRPFALHSLLFALGLGGIARAAEPMHVHVQAANLGQGMLFRWRDTCFALTAGHVMKGAADATLIGGANREVRGAGRLTALFGVEGESDLAMLRITGTLAQPRYCDTDLERLQQDAEVANKGAGTGTLAYVDREGQVTRMDVLVKSPRDDLLLIEPRQQDAGESLLEGRSGSLVYLGQRPLGMLTNKWAEDPRKGVVLAISRVLQQVTAHFANPKPLDLPPAPLDAQSAAAEQGNLLSLAAGAEVTEWSTLPARPENGPVRLLDAHGAHPWVARLNPKGAPVEVDFRLSGAQTPVIGRVELELPASAASPDGSAMSPPAQWASEVELLTSLTGTPGSWQSFGSAAILHQDELRKSVTSGLKPRARYLKLRIYKNRGDAQFVSLRRVRAYAP